LAFPVRSAAHERAAPRLALRGDVPVVLGTDPVSPSLATLFVERAVKHAERPLVLEPAGSTSYGEMLEQALGVAHGLGEAAPGKAGDHVALVLPNGRAFVAAFFGILLADRVPVPIDPRLHPREVSFLRRHCRTQATLTAAELGAVAGAATATHPVLDVATLTRTRGCALRSLQRGGRDAAAVLPTSGSTAAPKAVVLTHQGIQLNARRWCERYQLGSDDILCGMLSFLHSFGLTAWLVAAIDAGATVATVDEPFSGRVASIVAQRRATVFLAVGSYYRYLDSISCSSSDFATVRLFLTGACALPRSVAHAFALRFGRTIHQTYGLTEASPVVTANPLDGNRIDTVGPALGVELQVDEAGELFVRGDTIMAGYLDDPEATAACLSDDGWLRTGDLGRLDADGYLTILGRKKDLIVRGGEKIVPEEIEEALQEHPGVADAAVVGASDDRYEELPVAFVVLRDPSLEPAALLIFLRERIARYKVPREVHVVDGLPRTSNGKLLRRVLRERLQRGEGS
jgi:long-chain acyl-CoA synthetase